MKDHATTFHELFNRILDASTKEAEKAGLRLDYTAESNALDNTATIHMTFFPLTKTCPECNQDIVAPYGEWRNKPGYPGVRYICPQCYESYLPKRT